MQAGDSYLKGDTRSSPSTQIPKSSAMAVTGFNVPKIPKKNEEKQNKRRGLTTKELESLI